VQSWVSVNLKQQVIALVASQLISALPSFYDSEELPLGNVAGITFV